MKPHTHIFKSNSVLDGMWIGVKARLKSFLAIGGSLLLGAVAGTLSTRQDTGGNGGLRPRLPHPSPAVQGAQLAGKEAESKTGIQGLVQHVSEEEGFCGWDTEKQKEMLVRLRKKYGASYPSNVQLLLARLVRGLSGDQISDLLEVLPSQKEADATTRRFLVESLAVEDPRRAMELGRKLKDPTLVAITVGTVAHKSGAEALQLLVGMKDSEIARSLDEMTSAMWPSVFNGTVSDVADFLRKNTRFTAKVESSAFGNLLGKLVAQFPEDSAESLAQVRALAAEVTGLGKAGENEAERQKNADRFLTSVTAAAYQGLAGSSPGRASAFLQGVPESQKSIWLLRIEAVSRYRTQGLEAAIELAEKQGGDDFVKMAASGTWVAFAQKDREAAQAWVETLPEGPFRRGAYLGMYLDSLRYAWNETVWRHAIEAPGPLSGQSKVGYYEELIQHSRQVGDGRGVPSPGQIVEQTSLTTEQKDELYRRVAPIRQR